MQTISNISLASPTVTFSLCKILSNMSSVGEDDKERHLGEVAVLSMGWKLWRLLTEHRRWQRCLDSLSRIADSAFTTWRWQAKLLGHGRRGWSVNVYCLRTGSCETTYRMQKVADIFWLPKLKVYSPCTATRQGLFDCLRKLNSWWCINNTE